MKRAALLLALTAVLGCAAREDSNPQADSGTKTAPPPAPSGEKTYTTVEHVLGRGKIDQGREAMDTIRRVSAEKNEALDDVYKMSSE
jgi:hypothetical protein